MALRGRGLLRAEISRGVARGKHLGRCGRSLSGEETLGAGPEPDPRAFLALPLGDAWLYEARRGASPDCTEASRDPSDQRGKPSRVGSVRFRGSGHLSSHGGVMASKKKTILSTGGKMLRHFPGLGSRYRAELQAFLSRCAWEERTSDLLCPAHPASQP